jgi:hypothetical protein
MSGTSIVDLVVCIAVAPRLENDQTRLTETIASAEVEVSVADLQCKPETARGLHVHLPPISVWWTFVAEPSSALQAV